MCDDIKNNTLQVLQQSDERAFDVRDVCVILISILGVVLNVFLLCAIRLPKTCSVFVRNLAIVDLCTAFVSFFWVFREMISTKQLFATILVTFSWMFVFISFLTIFAIAVQRYIAVAYALWTHSTMKNSFKLLNTITVATWCISIIFCSARLYVSWDIVSFILSVIFEVIILSTIILYFMLFKSFRRYRVNNRDGHFSNQNRLKLQMERETKLTKTVFWVSGVLMIGVLPYVILLQLSISVRLFDNFYALKCNKTFKTAQSYWILMEMLAFSLNPVIYLLRYQVNRSKLNRIQQRLRRIFVKPNIRISADPEYE